MGQKFEIKNINSSTVLNLIQTQNLELSEKLLIDCPNLIDFRLFMYIILYILVISFFHRLEIEQINQVLIVIS